MLLFFLFLPVSFTFKFSVLNRTSQLCKMCSLAAKNPLVANLCIQKQTCVCKTFWKRNVNAEQRRLDLGMDTPLWFFQVWNQMEYQQMVLISFVHLEKIDNFCFMHKGVAQKLSLPGPLEYQTLKGHKAVNFWARDFSFWI